jgi:iron complex transport system substrate-binding protein
MLAMLFGLFNAAQAQSKFVLNDDLGRQIQLNQAPKRVMSLAPHLTEIIYAVGAQDRLIAVDLASDYPPEANAKKKVNAFPVPDSEALLSLRPDLILVWGAGFDTRLIEQWKKLGIETFVSLPESASDIANTMQQVARWSNNRAAAELTIQNWTRRAAQLAQTRQMQSKVSYFLQIWDQPLTTLSDQGIWGQASRWCSGANIFADQRAAAPMTDLEAVRARTPAVWLVGGGKPPSMPAGQPKTPLVTALSESLIQRPGPRWLDAVEQLCGALDRARQ